MDDFYSLGSLPLFVMGILALLASLGPISWCIYGRATLGYLGLYLVISAAVRMAVGLEILTLSAGLRINWMFSMAFMVIVMNLIAIHAFIHWYGIISAARRLLHARH